MAKAADFNDIVLTHKALAVKLSSNLLIFKFLFLTLTWCREVNMRNFNLRSWTPNSISLQKITTADKTTDHNTTVQILGLLWNTCANTMSLAPKSLPSSNIVSKHSVLQDSSQIFDPLGWATPVSICAKILLQEVWQQKRSWDTPLSEELRHR